MAKRKARSKPRSIQLKRSSVRSRRKRIYSNRRGIGDFLDSSISVRSLVKYSAITLSFVIILAAVFVLGRVSAGPAESIASEPQTQQLSGQTKQVTKQESAPDSSSSEETKSIATESVDIANLSDTETEFVYTQAEETDEEEEEEEVMDTTPSCKNKVAGFDYNYTNVEVVVSNYQRTMKGENWASLDSIKLTVTNNEKCIIINPTRIKIKMNPKGKGSVWWDDDVFLSDSFEHISPGKSVSEIIPIHVSYSDVHSEKDFRLTLFDDYGIPITTFKKYIILP
jgi:hypothetical protein